ncbi:uncharacterized protein LOC126795345 [Argentina anserina]|uniref:uncharacterized protein LOC126795345 n=1 Tax=Argentina anserina TaxID=57926 RepID=UPI002176459B|nr:uncharacterized protein LOC126795345 [Potentilla anserina]
MAMKIGSKALLISGVGYTGSVLSRNGKLSDVLSELRALLNGEQEGGGSDKIASQMYNQLLEEIRSARQTVVLNPNGGAGQGNLTSIVALGAVGYGYMWWKGLKLSDLMYVTKRNMASAVTSMTKSLDTVKEALVNTKKHLTQRIQNLDDKVLEQIEISNTIKDDVAGVQDSLTDLDSNINQLKSLLNGLDGKLCSLEEKADLTYMGVAYLCDVMPGDLQKQLKLSDIAPVGRLRSQPVPSITMGLKFLLPDNVAKLEDVPKNLLRSSSTELTVAV